MSLKIAMDWMLSQQSVERLIEEKGSILGIQNKSVWKEVKKMSATNMFNFVLNFSTLSGKLSFRSPTQ